MTAHPRTPSDINRTHSRASLVKRSPKILAVMSGEDTQVQGVKWSAEPGTLTVKYREFSPDALTALEPDVVVTGLLSRDFDCTDVARVLVEAEFSGEFRVLCTNLPKPQLVLKELRATYPLLDIDLWVLPSSASGLR
ncbi:MAG: hypothetical protein AAGF71_06505 [Pseudomonadota bacterium]